MAAVGTYLQVGVLWKVTQIEGHPLEHEVIVPEIDAGCN